MQMKQLLLMLLAGLFIVSGLQAQSRSVSGRVTDDKGNPVANATITVRGTTIGTTSSSEGNFTLTVPEGARALTVSYIGMGEKEITLSDASSMYNVQLSATGTDRQEVVVVGYGTQRRTNVTSSIGTVKAPDLENKPFTSVDQMLQGKVAGMQVPMSTGQPGAAQPIRIRGIGSHTAGASPLYVVDGVIINSGDQSRNTTTANALAGINTNDIESVNILKDAQATSIYGSRGSNGVIVITTKKGRAGKTKFRADVEVGTNTYADMPDQGRFLNADEWFMLIEEGLRNAGRTQAQIDATLNSFGRGNGVDTDWLDLVTRRGRQQQYNLSASGGDAKNQFYISAGYFQQEAAVIKSDFKRYSFRTNLRHVASDRLSFGVIASAGNTLQNTPTGGGAFANPVGAVGFLRPSQNPYNSDGSLNISTTGNTNFNSGVYNPLYIAENDRNNFGALLLNGNVSAEYAILKDLKFTTRFGVDLNSIEEYNFLNQFHGDGVAQKGIGTVADGRQFNWIATNQLDYNRFFGEQLRLDAKLGYEAQKSKGRFTTARATGFPPSNDLYLSVNAATPTIGRAEASDYSFAGIYSAVTVGFDERYILSGSFRRDGSSRFGDKYGNFWSVGAAWNIDKEAFLQSTTFLSGLKLRGSYGLTGNAAGIGNYAYRQTFGYGANYNGLPGGTFNNVGNADLTWETQYQADLGLDASFFKNRLALIVDVYRRISGELLFDRPLSRTTGFTSVTDNIGKLENKGIEVTVDATPLQFKDFTWDISFNLTRNKNKVVTTPNNQDITSGSFLLRPGFDYQAWYVREWAGVDPANGDPLWYVDGTHEKTTNVYNTAQRQLFGSAAPKFYGGLTSSLSFKGFDLTGEFTYQFGNLVRDSWMQYIIDGVDPTSNKVALNLQRWQKAGDITNVPKFVYNSTNNSSSFSSRFLYKGDFIRLRNLTLGYNMASGLASRLHLENLRLYVRGTNLFTKIFDENLTVDPEQGVNSASNFNVLYTRSMTLGINVGF